MQKNGYRIQFTSSRIKDLMYRTTFDPKKMDGDVILNLSLIDKKDLDDVLGIFKMVISSGLSVTPYVKIVSEGESLGDLTIEKGKVGIGTVCSITIDGVLLKAGIPVNPKLEGVVQIRSGIPVRFTDVLTYASTTVDPLEILMSQGITSVSEMLRTGSGKIVATVLAGAWMLDYLGEKEKSKAIFKATERVISEGKYVTYDLGGNAKLSQMAGEIAKYTAEILK